MSVKNLCIKLISFALLFIFFVNQLTYIFFPKDIYTQKFLTVNSFYDLEKESIDVLFLGPSTFHRTFSPLELWENYGFPSFTFSSAGQTAQVSYYLLIEALKYQNPKIVVLDAVLLFNQADADSKEGVYRPIIDALRWSKNKISFILDVVSKSNEQTLANFFFPLLRYHTRWDELEEKDFRVDLGSLRNIHKGSRGFYYNPQEVDFPEDYMQPSHEIIPLSGDAEYYYNKIIALCEEKNIQVILVTLPRVPWDYSKHNAVQKFADENQIEYIDFCVRENFLVLGLDPKMDFTNENHLNITGSSKVLIEFGKRLVDIGELRDKRNDPHYHQWNVDAELYRTKYKNLLKDRK